MPPEAAPATWTLITFVVYIFGAFVLAGLARHLARKRSFLSEYFLGSRSLGVWAFAMTYAATSASGGSFIGFPSMIYTHGWILALWIASYMMMPLCMGLLGKRLNQIGRLCGAVTVPDVFRDRHASPMLGLLATVFVVFFLVVYLVAQFKAGGLIILTLVEEYAWFQALSDPLAGLAASLGEGVTPQYLSGLLLFALVVVFYTAYGGFRAVVWTDVMQGLIMGLGVAVLLPMTLYTAYVHLSPVDVGAELVGKPLSVAERYEGREQREQESFRVGHLTEGLRKVNDHLLRNDPSAMTGPGAKVVKSQDGPEQVQAFLPLGMAISFYLMWAISGAGQPGNMVRMMAFRDSRTLRLSIFTVCIYYGMIYLPLVVIFVTAKTLPLNLEQPDQVMPAMARFVAPPLLAGLLIAAPFAAVMSTVDSFLLIISSALVRDVYQRAVNPQVSTTTLKIMSYAATAVVGAATMLLAVNPPRFLQDLIVFGGSGLSSTFLAAMALTIYWPRSNPAGTAAAMIGGFCSVAGLYLVGSLRAGQFEAWAPFGLHPIIWGLSGSLLIGVVVTKLTAPPPRALVTKYFCLS